MLSSLFGSVICQGPLSERGFDVGIYSLVVIIVMMLAVLVATKDPDGDSDIARPVRKRRSGAYVPPRPRQTLATTADPAQK